MKIGLKILEDDRELQSKIFEEGTYTLGKGSLCDIVISDSELSRTHLEIRVTPTSIYLTNLGEGRRVLVNGTAFETVEVKVGDVIQMGQYKLLLFEAEEVRSGAYAEALPSDSEELPKEVEELRSPAADAPFAFESPAVAPMESPAVDGNLALESETQVHLRPVVAKVMFTEGPSEGKEFFLEAYEVTFGRSRTADIFIDDSKLSRVHAKITRVGPGYRLIDMQSRNGTYVNGVRVLEHPLSSFDEITLGNSKFRFIIHDMAKDIDRHTGTGLSKVESTKSVHMDPAEQKRLFELAKSKPAAPPAKSAGRPVFAPTPRKKTQYPKIILGVVVLGLAYLFMTSKDRPTAPPVPQVQSEKKGSEVPAVGELEEQKVEVGTNADVDIHRPRALPKEFLELTPALQRAVEGHWQSAVRAADKELYEEAAFHLKKIHEIVPYYKQSREQLKQYENKLKVKQIQQAKRRAKTTEAQDVAIHLQEGLQYLQSGNFDAAADSFNNAIVMDPNNKVAAQGIRAAQLKINDINKVPPERDIEGEKRRLVGELFKQAVEAYLAKSYQKAVEIAEKIRTIELKGETKYLSEAKQIIDKARQQQKDQFEPFLLQAKEKYAEGDYNSSRDLCEEMLKRDPSYEPANDLLKKVKKQLNRLAKDAYVRGIILESMNKLDEAKQYWNRARNYVRSGDPYFEKVNKKLDAY